MTSLSTFNEPAFRARLGYFRTNAFRRRFERLAEDLRAGKRFDDDASFFGALGCTEPELAAWLTLKDAIDLHCGREPRHGFPALRGRGSATVDVKLTPTGDLLDYRFHEWAPGEAPANPKETMQ